jgi:hypothetical protein
MANLWDGPGNGVVPVCSPLVLSRSTRFMAAETVIVHGFLDRPELGTPELVNGQALRRLCPLGTDITLFKIGRSAMDFPSGGPR